MALVIELTRDLSNGVHARPASLVETLYNRFSSVIEWQNLCRETGRNARGVLATIGSNILEGDACELLTSGEDEAEVFVALTTFMRDESPHCDVPLPIAPTLGVQPTPESLLRLNPTLSYAHPVCAGSAGRTLVHLKSRDLHELGELPVVASPEQEQAALDNGLRLLAKDIEPRLLDNDGITSAILEAHRSLAADISPRQYLLGGILTGLSCAQAIVVIGDHFRIQFRDSGNSHLQERALDIRDVYSQLLQYIYGEDRFPVPGQLREAAIYLADELTPSQFLELDRSQLKGLLLRSGGTTLHTAILTRSFNIPTPVGVDLPALLSWVDTQAQTDDNVGLLMMDPSPVVMRYCQQEAWLQAQIR